ncbi:MAG: acyloxyacyl hydrolase [Gammaproteobacteria bacterium]|nr:acyloxyacyl hydrolase [Gammaproteobacteria bacterium]
MSFFKSTIIAFTFSAIILSATAATTEEYSPGKRAQLPSELNNTYIGMGAGYTDFPFSNTDLINGFQAQSFTNPSFGLNIFIGHYFNPYLAAEISLMRPVQWAYANNIVGDTAPKHSIWISLFGISLRPTLPITKRISLYGIAGLGIISRHGFNVGPNNTTAIPSTDLMTLLTGGGITYKVNTNWHLNLGLEHTFTENNNQQPSMTYAFGGFYYLFQTLHLPKYYSTDYIFHKNLIQIGGFSNSIFNPNVNQYFTVGYLPIFWSGDVGAKNGGWLMYERNIFHTHKIFSFDLGASISTYHSVVNNTSFQAFSVFPSMKFWFLRTRLVDLYFKYAIAGPTYLTQSYIDNIDLGGNFSFQDLLGIGAFIGQKKNFNVAATIGHYSNGNLLPVNPGVEVPLVLSVGYAF